MDIKKYLSQEDNLQIQIIEYVNKAKQQPIWHYPSEGKRSKVDQAIWKAKGGSKGVPDLFIPVARQGYYGLFLEVKRSGETVYLKDGGGKVKKRFEPQDIVLKMLRKQGYMAVFVVGWAEAKKTIDRYFE